MCKTDCEEQTKKVLCTGVTSPWYSTVFLHTQCVLHLFSFCKFVALTHIHFDFSIWLPSFISDPYCIRRGFTTPSGNCRMKLTVRTLLPPALALASRLLTCRRLSACSFSLNGLMVNGLLIQKSLERATTDTYRPGETGNFLKFLLSEKQGLHSSDLLTSKELIYLARALIFFIIVSPNSHSTTMH